MIFFKSFTRPRAICFDLDDTLYDNTVPIAAAERYIREFAGRHYLGGRTLSPEEYAETKAAVIRECPELAADVSMVRYFAYRKILLDFGYPRDKAGVLAHGVTEEFIRVRSRIEIPDDTLETLNALRRHYPMAALSNGNADMKRTHLAPVFEHIWRPVSGFSPKPAGDLFLMAAGYYGISPRELLFVGDDPLNDISGALRFGCQVCWQTQYRKTERELRALPHVMISHIRELIDLLL